MKNKPTLSSLTFLKLIRTAILPLFLIAAPAFSAPLSNGDFNTQDSWNDGSFSGSAAIESGIAVLATGAGSDPFSAALFQGDDGSFSFTDAISIGSDIVGLSFDVKKSLSHAVDEALTQFTDTLTVSIYDAFNPAADAFFLGDGSAAPGSFSVTEQWSNIQLDISALAGNFVALAFELSDELDGFDTTIYLDNIRFTKADVIAVSEPSSFALIALGLLALGFTRRSTKKKSS